MADEAEHDEHVRRAYTADLEQLRLQVELMGVRVDENLERMRHVLGAGDEVQAERAIAADDEVDAMHVSLMERCYTLITCEQPVASDLRLIVSSVKITSEMERVGDLALRVVKASADRHLLTADPRIHDVLRVMADEAVERYRMALQAWATGDLVSAAEVASGSRTMEVLTEQLTAALMGVRGPDAVHVGVATSTIGRALDRIADHAAIMGARVRYLITGEARHLAAEVR